MGQVHDSKMLAERRCDSVLLLNRNPAVKNGGVALVLLQLVGGIGVSTLFLAFCPAAAQFVSAASAVELIAFSPSSHCARAGTAIRFCMLEPQFPYPLNLRGLDYLFQIEGHHSLAPPSGMRLSVPLGRWVSIPQGLRWKS